MVKEYFWTEEGITHKSNAELILVKGQKEKEPVIERGGENDPDYNRIQYGSFINDKDGIFGVRSRLYLIYWGLHRNWKNTMNNDGSDHDINTCLAYTDDPTGAKGTWVKPNIGKYEYKGSYNNNIIYPQRISLTHIPGAPYKLTGARMFSTRFRIYGNSFEDLQLEEVEVTERNTDSEMMFYAHGKIGLTHHNHLKTSDGTYIGRVYGVNQATNLFPTKEDWVFPHLENAQMVGVEEQNKPNFKVRIPDGTGNFEDKSYGILPQDGSHQGGTLGYGTDIHGDYVLVAPDFQTNDYENYPNSENLARTRAYNEMGLGLFRDFPNDHLMTRIRGNDDDLLLNRSENGWDRGWVSAMMDSKLDTETNTFVFYSAWSAKETFINEHEIDVRQVGRAVWRRDGFTKMSISSGGFIRTMQMPVSGQLEINHVGDLQVNRIRNGDTTTATIEGSSLKATPFDVERGDILEFHNLTDNTVDLYTYNIVNDQHYKRRKAEFVIKDNGKIKSLEVLSRMNGRTTFSEPIIKRSW